MSYRNPFLNYLIFNYQNPIKYQIEFSNFFFLCIQFRLVCVYVVRWKLSIMKNQHEKNNIENLSMDFEKYF